MRSVVFVTEGKGAQDFYRCRLMARGLDRIGWRAHRAGGIVERPDGKLRGLVNPRTRQFTPVTSHVVLRMVADPVVPELARNARRLGQTVIYDIDDPIWLLPEWNPAHAHYFGPAGEKARAMVAECMAAVDVVTVPTLRALWMVWDVLGGGDGTGTSPVPESPRVVVVDNGVDIRQYPHRTYRPHDPLRVAWLGRTDYRGEDLRSIADQLADSLAYLGDRVEFVHLGAHPSDPQVEDLLGFTPARVTKEPWVDLDELPRALASVDLALLPQRRCEFAEARSTATGLALAAAGTPFLTTATGPYVALANEGAGSLVPDDRWGESLEWFVRHRDGLDWYSIRGRAAAEAHDIEPTARVWAEAVG